MYHIERAIFDIRRGLPVVIQAGDQQLLVQALEGGDSVSELTALSGSRPSLVLTRHRLEALGVSITADAACLPLAAHMDERALHALAATELEQDEAPAMLSGLQPAGIGEREAIALMRRALLIPAALIAEVSDGAAEAIVLVKSKIGIVPEQGVAVRRIASSKHGDQVFTVCWDFRIRF